MKVFLKILAGAVFFGALGWLGMYLYWHFKIVGAIKTMESQATPAPPGSPLPYSIPEEPVGEVRSAGCRAVPYLVNSLQAAKSAAFLSGALDLIRKALVTGDGLPPGELADIRFDADDGVAEREQKCKGIQTWWRYRGQEYHKSWRVWKDRCPRE